MPRVWPTLPGLPRTAVRLSRRRRPGTNLLLAGLLLFAGCTTPPSEYRESGPLAAGDRAALNARVFDRAWELVNGKYFDATFHGVDWAAMRDKHRPAALAAPDDATLYAVLNRLTGELQDRHTHAISPRQGHEGRSLSQIGLGLDLQTIATRHVVAGLTPGSPAEAAGVRPGWILLSPDEAKLASPPARSGQPIACTFLDDQDRPRVLELTPRLLPLDPTRFASRALAGGVRYLRFDFFNGDSTAWLNRELKTHAGSRGVILDLRANTGGDSTALQRTVREFFPAGRSLGQTIDRKDRIRNLPTLAIFPARYEGKVVILTDRTTASSAEIFSHALQFHHRATLVGQPTAGLVVAGYRHSLPGGGFINISERDYLGLDGLRLEGRGVTPDVLVAPTLADLRSGRDAILDAALATLNDP